MLIPLFTDITTPEGNCNNGDIRLGNVSDIEGGIQGQVEVCINNAWGTVCSERFGFQEAAVACRQLGGFNVDGE